MFLKCYIEVTPKEKEKEKEKAKEPLHKKLKRSGSVFLPNTDSLSKNLCRSDFL